MNKIYLIGAGIISVFCIYLGINYTLNLKDTVKLQKLEIETLKETQIDLIKMYDEEIEELNQSIKNRKVIVKEIVRDTKGAENEKCLNSLIPDVVIDKLRKYTNKK